jgi:ATP-dependent RNA helicase DeaD
VSPAHVVAGPPDVLVELLKGATVKLDSVRTVCIAWADELVAQGATPALETIMIDAPKDSGRTVVTAELNPAVEELLERYARRARRVSTPVNETDQPISVEYVSVSARSRLAALRRLLDQVDPASALVFARDSESTLEARDLLRALGYAGESSTIRVGLTAGPGTDVVVLFDLPASREELREAASAAKRTIALIQPRQLGSLRALTAGGATKPLTLIESGAQARSRDARTRDELRATLSAGQFGRELLALEPLLDEYDGIEIAAAALQLLERERAERAALPAMSATATKPREAGTMVRLFVNVGSRDGVRPADIVGTMASQPGVTSGDIGKVDVRESHSVVEVSAGIAELVIERVTGSTIRGRRAVARLDEGRDAARGPRDSARGGREGGRERPSGPRGGPGRGRDGARESGSSRSPSRGPSRGPRPTTRRGDE